MTARAPVWRTVPEWRHLSDPERSVGSAVVGALGVGRRRVSQADIVRRTGLSSSRVGVLVHRLADYGVLEVDRLGRVVGAHVRGPW